jgi:hypothetical protein
MTMRKSYDFKNGVRGKYASRFKDGGIIVLLEPDVAKAFPSARSVNSALRRVMRQKKAVATRQVKRNT